MSVLSRIRVLLLALAILAGGFAALGPQLAHEASAAGGCSVYSNVEWKVTAQGTYVWGRGDVACPGTLRLENHSIVVRLYRNGVLVREGWNGGINQYMTAYTGSIWASCGNRFQASVTHTLQRSWGPETTTHWSLFANYGC